MPRIDNLMNFLLATLVGLVTLDGLLTQFLVGKGMAREGNPLLEPMVGNIGFMILKIVGALLCALILWDVHRRYPRVGLIATSIAVVGYAVIVIWNTSLIILR
jgi:uncharacterized membrane protein YeaQ/YmgE (transglycosylase-associated protein family)